ncbi:MAG: hypothetical protein ACRD3T_10970 [Terriglobia bacterium]
MRNATLGDYPRSMAKGGAKRLNAWIVGHAGVQVRSEERRVAQTRSRLPCLRDRA